MKTYEFWRETATGEVWAIELREGVVARARGPLHWSEINPGFLRDGYDYSSREAAVIEARRDAFEPLDEAAVALLAGSAD